MEWRECADWNLHTSDGQLIICPVACRKLNGTWEVEVRYGEQQFYLGIGPVDWETETAQVQALVVEFCEGQEETE